MDIYFMLLATINPFILLYVFGYLYWEYRDRFVRLWCISGVILILKLAFDFTMIFLGKDVNIFSPIIRLLDLVSLAVAGYFLLEGSYAFIGKTLSKNWRYCFVFGMAWCTVGTFLEMPPLLSSLLPVAFMAISMFYTGMSILEYENITGIGKMLAGGGLIVWSVHLSLYPFTRYIVQVASYGYFFSAVISLVAAIALLNIYFQRMKKELEQSEARFRLLAENAQDVIYRFSLYGLIMGLITSVLLSKP